MNFNEYYRDFKEEAKTLSQSKRKKNTLLTALRLVLSTEIFKFAVPAHLALQIFIEYSDFFFTFDWRRCSRICTSNFEFSSKARDVTIFVLGAFVITSCLFMVRLCISIANGVAEGVSSPQISSYTKSLVLAFLPVISMSSFVFKSWGGVCVDSFG
jgi:hypothetical protein